MLFKKCSDCCKCCCCTYDEASGHYLITRNISIRQCEQNGGLRIDCVGPPSCVCDCTVTASVNDIGLPVFALFAPTDYTQGVVVNTTPTAVSVCQNLGDTEWEIVAAAQYGCGSYPLPESYWLRIMFWVRLYWVFPGGRAPAWLGGLDGSAGTGTFDYFFDTAGESEPGYPCPTGQPVLQPGGGWSIIDITQWGCTAQAGWQDELQTILDSLQLSDVEITCDPYVENCDWLHP